MNLLAVAVWIGVITSTVLLLRALRRSQPPPAGPAPRLHDLSEAAFLAGGPGAVVDAALVSLLCDGRLVVGGPGIIHAPHGAWAADPAERTVMLALQRAPSGWLYQVRYAAMLDPSVQETGDALAERGLVSRPGWGRRWRRWGLIQALVCGALVPLSLPLSFLAWTLDSSQVPFIVKVVPVLLGGLVMGAVCAARAGRRITPAGQAALREMRSRYAGDPAPQVRTALFGLAGLRDPFLREQLVPAARQTRLAAAQSAAAVPPGSGDSCGSSAEIPEVWCATSDGGGGFGSSGSGCGGGSGSSCSSGSGGSSCSSGSSGSSCGGGSSSS
ncbi:TIGR04222 domain-containing membrane protein [Streptomyces sp. NPDC003042]